MSAAQDMMDGITGKAFIVTGAGSGIGAAMCAALSRRAGRVAAVDLDYAAVKATVAGLPGEAVAIGADVTTANGTDDYVRTAAEAFGDIHGVHLNAGVLGQPGPLADTEPEDYDWEMAVNARGVYLGLRSAIRHMRERGTKGSIVVTASTAGLGGSQGLGIYSTSKHAAVALMKAAALDHAGDGIRVNAICPGEVDTPMLARAIDAFAPTAAEVAATRVSVAAKIPLGRVADPSELAEAATWLLSSAAGYVSGSTLVVDGALTAGRFTPAK